MRVNDELFKKLALKSHLWNQEAFQVTHNFFALIALVLAFFVALSAVLAVTFITTEGYKAFAFVLFSWQFACLFLVLLVVLLGTLGGLGLAFAHRLIRLKNRLEKIQRSSEIDPLSKLKNRRAFKRILNEEINRNSRHGGSQTLGLLFLDIDFFKKVNDTYGHNAGDYIISELSKFLETACRPYDTVARWGGEEIVILTPHTATDQLCRTAERLRIGIESYDFEFENITIPITISIGLALYQGESIPQFIEAADMMLLEAKESGRNCFKISDSNPKT